MPELPPRVTRATLAGPLCQGTDCRCRTDAADAGAPANASVKRYEVVLGPSDDELWASIGGMVLYKSRERARECFYLDLPSPGEHAVTLRAHGDAGYGARMTIRERKADAAAWYSTFEFVCGAPGACNKQQLREFRASLDQYKRGIHDPCGSTKIQGLEWDTGRMPDIRVPNDLYLQLVLKVYEFAPENPPGHASCKDNY